MLPMQLLEFSTYHISYNFLVGYISKQNLNAVCLIFLIFTLRESDLNKIHSKGEKIPLTVTIVGTTLNDKLTLRATRSSSLLELSLLFVSLQKKVGKEISLRLIKVISYLFPGILNIPLFYSGSSQMILLVSHLTLSRENKLSSIYCG